MDDDEVRPLSWTVIGGHPALDLCNTRSWRLDPARSIDRLDTPARLSDWYDRVLRPKPTGATGRPRRRFEAPAAGPVDLAWAHRLRDATIAVLDGHLGGESAPDEALDTITDAWRQALSAARPSTRLPLTWAVDPANDRALQHSLTLTVIDLLEHADLDVLRRCDGPGCGWLFLDHTRNHSRRWCGPQDCGNRARVRAYAQRHGRTPTRS
jgi:predicted RNA-binding Zn ribbon-like protein